MAEPFARRGWPLWAKVALPVAVLVAVIAAVGPDEPVDPPGSGSGSDAVTTPQVIAPAKASYALGETARTGDFDVTVLEFRDPQAPGPFLLPKDGDHFVSVDVHVANRTATPQTFSSLLGLHLVDGTDRQFDAALGDVSPPPPDGEVPPGGAVRGRSLFEVPDGTTGLRLRVQGRPDAQGVVFTLA